MRKNHYAPKKIMQKRYHEASSMDYVVRRMQWSWIDILYYDRLIQQRK